MTNSQLQNGTYIIYSTKQCDWDWLQSALDSDEGEPWVEGDYEVVKIPFAVADQHAEDGIAIEDWLDQQGLWPSQLPGG